MMCVCWWNVFGFGSSCGGPQWCSVSMVVGDNQETNRPVATRGSWGPWRSSLIYQVPHVVFWCSGMQVLEVVLQPSPVQGYGGWVIFDVHCCLKGGRVSILGVHVLLIVVDSVYIIELASGVREAVSEFVWWSQWI